MLINPTVTSNSPWLIPQKTLLCAELFSLRQTNSSFPKLITMRAAQIHLTMTFLLINTGPNDCAPICNEYVCQHNIPLNYLQTILTNKWQCGAANLQLQAGCAGPEELELVQKLWVNRQEDKQPALLHPARRIHLPAVPVTPVPAEVHIRDDILTSVPESLINSVLPSTSLIRWHHSKKTKPLMLIN